MAAPNAVLNDILDAIRTSLAGITIVGGYNFDLSNANVVRTLLQNALQSSRRPVVAIEAGRYVSAWKGAGSHEATATVMIYLLTEHNEASNGEATLINLARDVEKKIRSDETLGGLVRKMGQTFEFTPETENLVRTGMAFASIEFPVTYRTDHSAP